MFSEIINQIGLESRKDCEMILFTGRPVDWLGRVLPEAKFEEKNAPRFFNLFYLSDRYQDICKKQCLGTSWMGWGPVDWVVRVLPEAKFEKNAPRILNFFYLSDRYWDICKKRCLGTSWMSLKLYCWYGKHCKYVKVHCWGWTTLDREDALDNPGHTRVKQRYFCHISQPPASQPASQGYLVPIMTI